MRLLTAFLFLLLVALFFQVTKKRHVASVEQDLTTMVNKTERPLGLNVEVDHLDIHLTGHADAEEAAEVVRQLRSRPGYLFNKINTRAEGIEPRPESTPALQPEPAPALQPEPTPALQPEPTPRPSPRPDPDSTGVRLPNGFVRPEAPPKPSPAIRNPRAEVKVFPPTVPSTEVLPEGTLVPPVLGQTPPTPPISEVEIEGDKVGSAVSVDPITLLTFSRTLGDCSVRFAGSGTAVPASESPKLQAAAQAIRSQPGLRIGLRAQIGDPSPQSVRLGTRRANVVRDELIRLGVSGDRLAVRRPLYVAGIADRLDFEVVDE